VVVDDADDLDLAGVAGLVLLAALPGRPVPGPIESGQLERVDVQQGAGLRPLIAPGALRALAASPARDTMTPEHLVDRRTVPTGEELQLHRPVVGLAAGVQDRLLSLRC
jgi:hypothetical protein